MAREKGAARRVTGPVTPTDVTERVEITSRLLIRAPEFVEASQPRFSSCPPLPSPPSSSPADDYFLLTVLQGFLFLHPLRIPSSWQPSRATRCPCDLILSTTPSHSRPIKAPPYQDEHREVESEQDLRTQPRMKAHHKVSNASRPWPRPSLRHSPVRTPEKRRDERRSESARSAKKNSESSTRARFPTGPFTSTWIR